MKDPIRIFIDEWNQVYGDVPWTTWTYTIGVWILAAIIIILLSEGVIG